MPKNNKKIKEAASQEKNGLRSNRIFVLDTNVLLHDARSIYAFKGVVIAIPFIILEELDKFKRESGERGHNAREIIRNLDELRSRGSLGTGVELNNNTDGAILKIVHNPREIDFDPGSQDIHDIKDNMIIQTTIDLAKDGNKVTLVSKDINVRIKADALGMDAEDYSKGAITYDHFYKGWRRIALPASELKSMTDRKTELFLRDFQPEEPIWPNEFVILESENNPDNNKLFRHMGSGEFKTIHPLSIMNSFEARNIQQLMALELLLDDNIQLLSLMGPAGTGKTFITLVAGLLKVTQEHVYRKLLVTRPVVPLGADVGYLPGDLQEKLHFWMQPIHDNMDLIFNQMNQKGEDSFGFEKKKKEKHGGHRFRDQRSHDRKYDRYQKHRGSGNRGRDDDYQRRFRHESSSIDHLVRKGVLSMEAITYMRGRSIPYQFMFIDEVQNLTPHEVKTLVSRAGEGTKVILAGDPFQIDSPYLDFSTNGLTVTSEKMKQHDLFGSVFLEISERSKLARLAAEVL